MKDENKYMRFDHAAANVEDRPPGEAMHEAIPQESATMSNEHREQAGEKR